MEFVNTTPNAVHQLCVLILCAGDGRRWGGYLGRPKQLLPLGGRPLLLRTVEQVRRHFGVSPIMVTHDAQLCLHSCPMFPPRRCRWTVETLLSTRPLWARRTVALLGDVFYTETALTLCRGHDEGLVIFGRRGASLFSAKPHGEIFAVSFDYLTIPLVTACLQYAVLDAQKGARGKLWDFYLACQRVFPEKSGSVRFCEIHDYTEDFDTPEEYRALRHLYSLVASPSPLGRLLAKTWSMIFCVPRGAWHRWKQWRRDRKHGQSQVGQPVWFTPEIGHRRQAA